MIRQGGTRRKTRRGFSFACAGWLLALPLGEALADDAVQLPPVNVRSEWMSGVPSEGHSTTVIDAEDIDRSAATTLAELLAREANVNLQSLFGHDKKATVDIRGMGETALSNVVILVDGVRLNEIDLSGSDLSGLILSQIERIRIVRGGGSVRVGDGAVGGVIDITTRRQVAGIVSGSLRMEEGAYGTRKLNASVGGTAGPFSLLLKAGRAETDGFRRNGFLSSRDGSAELRFSPHERFSVFVRATRHFDEYGLPATLPVSVLSQGEAARRATTSPNDRGSTDDAGYAVGADVDFGSLGVTRLQATARRRENPFSFCGATPNCPGGFLESERDALQIDHEIEIETTPGAKPHRIGLGLNHWNGEYARFTNMPVLLGTERISGDANSHGGYVDAVLRLNDQWAVNAGARIDRFRSSRTTEMLDQPLIEIFPGVEIPCAVGVCSPVWNKTDTPSRGSWRNHAREFGLSWDATRILSFHLSTSRHFRSPNVDELVVADEDLGPQRGKTNEAGVRLRPGPGRELSLSVFRMRIEDEIYYGPEEFGGGLPKNRNLLVPTKRHGLEFQLRWPLAAGLNGALSFGYVRPRLQGLDSDIPSVPRRTASARLEWQAKDRLDMTLAARYASSSVDGSFSGGATVYPLLGSYVVVDTGIRWRFGTAKAPMSLSFTVNNLFDRAYATKQYGAEVYPMPGRHAMVAANVTF